MIWSVLKRNSVAFLNQIFFILFLYNQSQAWMSVSLIFQLGRESECGEQQNVLSAEGHMIGDFLQYFSQCSVVIYVLTHSFLAYLYLQVANAHRVHLDSFFLFCSLYSNFVFIWHLLLRISYDLVYFMLDYYVVRKRRKILSFEVLIIQPGSYFRITKQYTKNWLSFHILHT